MTHTTGEFVTRTAEQALIAKEVKNWNSCNNASMLKGLLDDTLTDPLRVRYDAAKEGLQIPVINLNEKSSLTSSSMKNWICW